MIKVYLEQAIKSILADKEKKISEIKDRVMREKIVPFNSEVDKYRAKALSEIDMECNSKISEIKQEYEKRKQELVTLGENKKKENYETLLASEISVVSIEYDEAVSKLNAQISEIKE